MSIKLVVVGDSGVGKTTFVNRVADAHTEARFWSTRATIGAEFITRTVPLQPRPVRVQLWDTAGQERFRALSKTYFRGSDGFVLVFDASQRDSYFHLFGYWLTAIRDACGGEEHHPPVLLLANKTDLPRREISAVEASALCSHRGWYYAEVCSERTGTDAAQALDWFVGQLMTATQRPAPPPPLPPLLPPRPAPAGSNNGCAC